MGQIQNNDIFKRTHLAHPLNNPAPEYPSGVS
jgi:hypothetical protein